MRRFSPDQTDLMSEALRHAILPIPLNQPAAATTEYYLPSFSLSYFSKYLRLFAFICGFPILFPIFSFLIPSFRLLASDL